MSITIPGTQDHAEFLQQKLREADAVVEYNPDTRTFRITQTNGEHTRIAEASLSSSLPWSAHTKMGAAVNELVHEALVMHAAMREVDAATKEQIKSMKFPNCLRCGQSLTDPNNTPCDPEAPFLCRVCSVLVAAMTPGQIAADALVSQMRGGTTESGREEDTQVEDKFSPGGACSGQEPTPPRPAQTRLGILRGKVVGDLTPEEIDYLWRHTCRPLEKDREQCTQKHPGFDLDFSLEERKRLAEKLEKHLTAEEIDHLWRCTCPPDAAPRCRSCGGKFESPIAQKYGACYACLHQKAYETLVKDAANGFHGSILLKAHEIINGDRRDSYGSVQESFQRIADLWEGYRKHMLSPEIQPQDVAMLMILLKVARQQNKYATDNLVDIAGYAGLAEDLG